MSTTTTRRRDTTTPTRTRHATTGAARPGVEPHPVRTSATLTPAGAEIRDVQFMPIFSASVHVGNSEYHATYHVDRSTDDDARPMYVLDLDRETATETLALMPHCPQGVEPTHLAALAQLFAALAATVAAELPVLNREATTVMDRLRRYPAAFPSE